MFERAGEGLRRRAAELGLDRAATLQAMQQELDRRWPGQTRAVSLNNGVLMVYTPSAPLASELRLQSGQILQHPAFKGVCQRLRIDIRA